MKLKEMENDGVGKLPEYGAIFMSNSITKKECLRRKLFGLSSTHNGFVKHIKVGMILFLFEYERRELHGVFQACSDGGIDIVPHAFSKSGMHCPAQVKFKSLWVCNPLSEHEFRDAIQENYFTGKKFSFGLSEAQVEKLLCLFSLKVLRVPERQLAKNGKAKLVVRSMEEVRQFCGSGSKVHDRLNGEHTFGHNNMHIDPGESTRTGYSLLDNVELEHSKYQFADSERVPNDGGFLMNDEFQDKCKQVSGCELRSSTSTEYPQIDKVEAIDRKLLISGRGRSDYCPNTQPLSAVATEFSKYCYGDKKRAQPDGGLMTNYDFQNVCNEDNGFVPPVRSKNSSLVRCNKLGGSSFLGIANSLVPDQTITKPPSQAHHQMESQLLSSLSSKASYRDAVVMSTHPNDSVVTSFPNYQYPLSNEVNCRSMTEGYKHNDGCSENVISSSMQQPSLSYPSRSGPKGSLDRISTFGNCASFSGPSHPENAYRGTIMGLSQMACSQNLDAEPVKNQLYDGLSSSKLSLADIPAQRAGINGKDNMFSDDPYNTNMYSSSLEARGYQIEPEDQLRFEAARRREIRESVMGNIAIEFEDPFACKGYLSSEDFQSSQHYEHNSFEYDHEHYQSSDAYYSGSRKNRTSVFSRLTFASDEYPPERNSTVSYVVSDMSMSVDGIMKMLHKSHQQWVKPKKLKQGMRKDDNEKPRDKTRTTASCDADVVLSKSSAKDIKVDCSLAGPEQAIRSTEVKPFLNFKRRSEMRKLHNDGTTTFCNASSRLEGELGGQQKKRKLVRPNFSKNASSGNSDMRRCTSSLQAPVKEVSFTNDNTGGCEAKLRNQDNERTGLSGNQPDQGDEVFDTEGGETRQRHIKPLGVGAEAGKESSINDVGIQSGTISGKCEGKIPYISKDTDRCVSTVEVALHNCNITNDSLVQVPDMGLPNKGAETGKKFGAEEFERNNKADLLPSAPSVDETCINSSLFVSIDEINSSSDKVPEMQKEVKEHTATSVDTIHVSATKYSEGTFGKPKSPLEKATKRRKLKRE